MRCEEVILSLQFTKFLSPKKLDEKAGIFRCERMESIIHFSKNVMA